MNRLDCLKPNFVNRQKSLLEAVASLKAGEIADPRPEAELLLRYALSIDRAELYAGLGEGLTQSQLKAYRQLIKRRAAGEPSAYITGRREFFGLDFHVDYRVLIPRPETELLVEKALELAGTKYAGQDLTVADIGTGSGAIAISLAKHIPRAKIYATDISPDALIVARTNCKKQGVTGRITLIRGNLLDPVPEPVDLVVGNLPYIPTRVYLSLGKEIKDHEPEVALHGGVKGLDLIFQLLEQAPAKVRPGASLLLEIAAGQAKEVLARADMVFPSSRKQVLKDLASLDRAVLIETP